MTRPYAAAVPLPNSYSSKSKWTAAPAIGKACRCHWNWLKRDSSHSRNCKSCKTFNSVPMHTSVYAPSEQPSFRRQVCCNSAQALERRMSHLLGCNISCCFLSKPTWTSKRVLCNHGAGSSGKDEPCSRNSPSIASLFRLAFISLFPIWFGVVII